MEVSVQWNIKPTSEVAAYLFEGTLTLKQTGLHGYTVRALPYHEDLQSPHELGLITWA